LSGKYIQFERRDRAGVITFDNPAALNALNSETLEELETILLRAAGEEGLRALILTGRGKAFIAGADIREMAELQPAEAADFSRRGQRVLNRIRELPLPVIAGVNGFALGGGLEVALACDFIWAAESARLGLPETTLGIFPGFSGSRRLAERIGSSAARELIYTGRMITAGEALSLGLVNRVLPGEELLPALENLAGEMAKAGPLAVSRIKSLLNRIPDLSAAQADQEEASEFGRLFALPEQREGMSAFLEKRKPEWSTEK